MKARLSGGLVHEMSADLVNALSKSKVAAGCWVGCIHRTDKKPGKWLLDRCIDRGDTPVGIATLHCPRQLSTL
jgi:hypothetical protein